MPIWAGPAIEILVKAGTAIFDAIKNRDADREAARVAAVQSLRELADMLEGLPASEFADHNEVVNDDTAWGNK